MKANVSKAVRKKIVANTLGSMRVAKLAPSPSLLTSLDSYINGQKTTNDLLIEARLKYVALRHGQIV